MGRIFTISPPPNTVAQAGALTPQGRELSPAGAGSAPSSGAGADKGRSAVAIRDRLPEAACRGRHAASSPKSALTAVFFQRSNKGDR
jgi:hypothetical protein